MNGVARDSIVSPGCVVSGGSIESSVLSPNVKVHEDAKRRRFGDLVPRCHRA